MLYPNIILNPVEDILKDLKIWVNVCKMRNLKLTYLNGIIFSQIKLIKSIWRNVLYCRESEFIHNTRTVFRYNLYHARGLLARGVPFFMPKIHRFSAKKVKSTNRSVFKIKTGLSVLIDLFQKREPFRDYFKTNQF